MYPTITPAQRRYVENILIADNYRMDCLYALRTLDLPQGYIGAGFLRNAIWDAQHEFVVPTPLNDVDVIYFDPHDLSVESERVIKETLQKQNPMVPWQVKNQARMHIQHNHAPYTSCEDAISMWIERETCVAVRMSKDDAFEFLAPFGLSQNMAGTISVNPKISRPEVFHRRVATKKWLKQWPQLRLVSAQ
jgi:hypothetical protein